MRIALINPNTTASMTRKMAAAASAVAGPSTEIAAITAAMGPASIEGYYDEALAVPGLLKELRNAEAGGADAAIIGCFDDTGLDAARAMSTIPVLGLCEAALSLAGFLAKRISVVTTDLRARVPIEELVERYGMAGKVRVRAAGIPVLELDNPRSTAISRLKAEIAQALEADNAEAIVLGCAGMADLAASLQQEFGVPVIDGVVAAARQAEALVSLNLRTSKRGAYAYPAQKAYSGYLFDK
ncbi:aspartate/glutamate racemase family protein [Bosea sp. BK604]|uniref:aspartate/glutamate racemase family protein n=1 Tax=Bosea sp. BK604 TaxID=2512180 RepID=UPI001051A4EB|nr:aspartate/glutamate racemase family protein [Bosea sp. BK604]TCR67400.1 allantoin racemase [Bosea sp. BK604]